MTKLVSVAAQSIAQEKLKHAANAAAGGVSVTMVPDWIGIAGGVAALLVSFAVFYKTYQDIQNNKLQQELLKLKLSKEGRRNSDIKP